MKKYKIIVTPDAKEDLRAYLSYLRIQKKNPQAAKNVLEDFRATKENLSSIADSLADPESEKLKEKGLKRLNFVKGHRYFVLFKIETDGKVYITDVFHMLENFESKLR